MPALILRDACLVAGTVMASVGAGMQWGMPYGLMVGGALVIALTVYTFWNA